MNIQELDEKLSRIEHDVEETRKMLNILFEENNILSEKSVNIAKERIRIKDLKKNIYLDWLERLEEYEECIDKEYFQIEKGIKEIQAKCKELQKENQRILSQKSRDVFDEIIKRVEEEKKRTGKNPLDV